MTISNVQLAPMPTTTKPAEVKLNYTHTNRMECTLKRRAVDLSFGAAAFKPGLALPVNHLVAVVWYNDRLTTSKQYVLKLSDRLDGKLRFKHFASAEDAVALVRRWVGLRYRVPVAA